MTEREPGPFWIGAISLGHLSRKSTMDTFQAVASFSPRSTTSVTLSDFASWSGTGTASAPGSRSNFELLAYARQVRPRDD